MQSQEGSLKQANYFQNTGGLNTTDTPFSILENQASGGFNFDYLKTGGFQKRWGHGRINSIVDGVLKTLGAGVHTTSSGTKTVLRFTDSVIKSVDVGAGTLSTLTEDTLAAGSTVFTSGSTVPVVTSAFTTAVSDLLWAAGGGASGLYGAYSGTKYTKNGSVPPTGVVGATVSLTGGSFPTIGSYRYAFALRKASTQAISNVALEVGVTLANTTDKVTLDFTTLTGLDTTKYDKIVIYRSAVSGAVGFTSGDIVATIASTSTSYVDTYNTEDDAVNVPRAGNTVLDNSVLPSGTYKCVTTFKRRLVTAANSTLYISELNAAESWPSLHRITLPSGGPITALAVISFATPNTSSIDEYLVIFKERELWVVTGDGTLDDLDIPNWSLTFIDQVGCVNQALCVIANGFLAWIDYRGVYLWDGSSKPIYCSRPVESLFRFDGDIDKTKLSQGFGVFYRKNSQVIWVLSHNTLGEQMYALKLDLRLTLPSVSQSLGGRVLDGVFTPDKLTSAFYGGTTYLPTSSSEELFFAGDGSGYCYNLYSSGSDNGTGIDFYYDSAWLNCETPGRSKRVHKVIVWVEELGTWDLDLTYWKNYKSGVTNGTTVSTAVSDSGSNTAGLWDIGSWDDFYWDDYEPKTRGLVFNIPDCEGDAFKFRFAQPDADAPMTVYGFSVLYTDLGVRK